MCSNCNNNVLGNNMNSFNNPNMQSGTVGLVVENGNNTNTAVLTTNTNPFNNGEVLNANINTGNNLYNLNNNAVANLNDNILNNFNNNSCNCNNNNSCGCNCNGNNSCGCNCNGCNCNNNSCECNCNGNNNNTLNTANNNNYNDNDNVTNNSLQRNLRNFIGRRVTLEFNNCGTCSKKTGVLTCVGCNFVTLRSVNNNTCLLADTAGLNFVTVHNCGS